VGLLCGEDAGRILWAWAWQLDAGRSARNRDSALCLAPVGPPGSSLRRLKPFGELRSRKRVLSGAYVLACEELAHGTLQTEDRRNAADRQHIVE
jgi:hypothetical protein